MAFATTLPTISDESGLALYLREILRFPVLEPEEEYMLARRCREQGDREAAQQLVTSHLRLVAKISMGYRGYGLPVTEVISEGNIGLMQAVNRFDPERGFRLASYAVWRIRALIQDYILRSWSLVRMGTTESQKRLFFKLRHAKAEIAAVGDGDLCADQIAIIADRLGVAAHDVADMNRRLRGDVSLNASLRQDDDDGEWQDWLPSDTPDQECVLVADNRDHQDAALAESLAILSKRERRIFEARHLADPPVSRDELAREFDISRERARLEVQAFEKVRNAVRARLCARDHVVVAAVGPALAPQP